MFFAPNLGQQNHGSITWISWVFYGFSNILVVLEHLKGLSNQIKIGWIIVVSKSEK